MPDMITTRPMEQHDVDPVLDLLRAALGETRLLKRTPELFAWKHFENPFGRSIAVVAEADGRVVGLRAFMRWTLRTVAGDELRCVRAVDTATHPEYQRRGIFRRLTEEAIEIARDDGIDLVFNTPNPKSGAGYLSMGWREVGSIGVLVRASLRMITGGRYDDDTPMAAEDFIHAPDPAAPPPVTDRPAQGLRTPRIDDYLEWRYASHPTARYYQVTEGDSIALVRPNIRNGRRELIVADVHGTRPTAVLREVARRSKAAYLGAWFSPGSPERRAAIRAGILPVPGVKALTLMARPLRELPFDVSSLKAWDLATSDLELL